MTVKLRKKKTFQLFSLYTLDMHFLSERRQLVFHTTVGCALIKCVAETKIGNAALSAEV